MEPEAFIAEVYGRISRRRPPSARVRSWAEMANDPMVVQSAFEMAPLLPEDKDAAILDVGFGRGWFVAACVSLGYRNITAAEFGVENYAHMREWSPGIKLQNVDTYIAGFLAERPGVFEFIHLSHLIEHIPKYTLLHFVDSLFVALKSGKGDAGGGGTLFIRTPNMEGPCATSSYFVTLGHEYGFAGSNLVSLLDICNFDDIRFHQFRPHQRSVKQRFGDVIRAPFLQWNAVKHRLFGVNEGAQWGMELIVSAKRGDRTSLLDERCR